MALAAIVIKAYHIKYYQFSSPSWLTSERYDIVATIPAGATPEQQLVMLQNMLVKRFGLKIHREPKEMSGYALTVAKGGPKFKASLEDGPPANSPPDPEGYPVLGPKGGTLWVMGMGGVMRERIGMEELASKLGGMLGGPVQDETGLSGKYDLRRHWGRDHSLEDFTAADPRSRASDGLAAAVQSQLGLNLQRKTVSIEMLVVDHAEKVPAPN